MDEDSLDELVDRSLGLSAAPEASDAEESSDGASGGSEDTASELGDGSDGEEEGDPEDGSGSEESEDDDSDDDEEALVAADPQGELAINGAGDSDDDDAESCPICLNTFRDQAVGTPEGCAHYFCLDCILEWAKNANSCPVDRTLFKCICIRAQFGGKVLKKVPVESARAREEDEDPTFCELCGRSDREDRLLLCDGCDAGYHMECLDPPLQEVPVDEWFCPGCASPGAAGRPADADPVSEEEVSLLLVDVVPTASRLRPREGRTRAIARTRQSERVRATVNRNRMSTARSIQHVPRYLVSSLLDETIEAVASGLSTAVYQRPTTPRAPAKRRRRARRRRKVQGRKKAPPGPAAKGRSSGTRPKRRQGRGKKRKGQKLKAAQSKVTARGRIARTLGLRRPTHGACIPSVCRPADPSLGLMRADIGAASLSVFGDPYELDPFDSSEEPSASPVSPLSAKRRVLSRSALRSHQPVARPVSVGLSRRSIPTAAPEPDVDEAPVPDLLGSILSGQSLLLMDSADITIHRDGSLSAKRAAPVSSQRHSVGLSRGGEGPGPRDGPQPPAPSSGRPGRSAPSRVPALTSSSESLDPSATPRPGQAQSSSSVSISGVRRREGPHLRGDSERAGAPGFTPRISDGGPDVPATCALSGQAPRPAPRRPDISQLPRIPKMRRDGSGWADTAPAPAPAPAGGQRGELPSACISRLTGREGPGQPGLGARAEGSPRGRGPQEPGVHSGGGAQTPAPLGPSRGKGGSSTFESFRINIPGNAAHPGRLSSPGFCNTFRPVDSKTQRKESPAPLFSLRKTKQLKSEIYDPFNPTGSDSSSAGSSPERLGPSLLPSEITRTISIGSPRAPPSQTVRCVTSYTVKAVFGEPAAAQGPSSSPLRLRGEEPWGDEDRPPRTAFFGSETRRVTCVPAEEPATHRIVELRSPSPSRSPSSSSSGGGRERDLQEQASAPGPAPARARSRDGSPRSLSPPGVEDQARRPPKARARRSSSDRSSSHERAKRRKAEDRSRERRRESRGRARRRSGSRSGSPGSSEHTHRQGGRRRRRSGSRSQGSQERAWRPRRPRERSRERPRDKRASRERRRHRSRSPSPERRSREHRRPRSREKRPRPHSRSPGRKLPVTEASPGPPSQEQPEPGPGRNAVAVGPQAAAGAGVWPEGAEAAQAPPAAPPAPEVPAEGAPEDLDYADSVEAGHVFDDLAGEGLLAQLDDMSSPPSPESSGSSSPERAALPAPPARPPPDHSLAAIRREVSLIHSEDAEPPLPWTKGPHEKAPCPQGPAQAALPGAPGGPAGGGVQLGKEESPCPTSALRAKAPVKRVTWNLQEAAGGAPAEDRALRTPLHRPQQPQEEAWEPGDGGLLVDSQQAPCPELPPAYTLPEPGFPPADPAQVYGSSLPPALALPSSVPPYAPVSQPTVQFILQGSLPLAGCGAAPSLAPVPTVLTTASEPAGHATATNNSEERTATPRPAPEKAKNEEYLKKLHMQERAVEEVKLAIKPFYQKREVTKEEYKDILRKAVQKICHSKSGEINPVKVGNLVKAYVDKYRHMRRHRRPEAGEPAAEA